MGEEMMREEGDGSWGGGYSMTEKIKN